MSNNKTVIFLYGVVAGMGAIVTAIIIFFEVTK